MWVLILVEAVPDYVSEILGALAGDAVVGL